MARNEASERLNECSKKLDIGVNRSEWMTDRCQLLTFLSFMSFTVAIDLVEVEKNPTDEMLTNLIKERIKFRLRTVLEELGD